MGRSGHRVHTMNAGRDVKNKQGHALGQASGKHGKSLRPTGNLQSGTVIPSQGSGDHGESKRPARNSQGGAVSPNQTGIIGHSTPAPSNRRTGAAEISGLADTRAIPLGTPKRYEHRVPKRSSSSGATYGSAESAKSRNSDKFAGFDADVAHRHVREEGKHVQLPTLPDVAMAKRYRTSDRSKGFPLNYAMPMVHCETLLPGVGEFGYFSGTRSAKRGGLTELGCIAYPAPAVTKHTSLRKRKGSLVTTSMPSLHDSSALAPINVQSN